MDAQRNRYNPWWTGTPVGSGSRSPVGGKSNDGCTRGEGEKTEEEKKEKPEKSVGIRIVGNVEKALRHSWVNVLLVFVPAGIAAHFAGADRNAVFALNAVAIVPLAGLLTYATEQVAFGLGPTLGALLNVSFGNAVELIIFIIALVKDEIRIVQASLIGSILANLLLISGMAFLLGGLQYREQIYDSTVTQLSACLLALAVLSLLVPTAFHVSFSDLALADRAVVKLSRGTSVILLIIYVLYLLFQLKSHRYLYQGTPQHRIDEETAPGFLARFDSAGSSSSSATKSSSGSKRRVGKRLRAKLGKKRASKVETEIETDGENVGRGPTGVVEIADNVEIMPPSRDEKGKEKETTLSKFPVSDRSAWPKMMPGKLSVRPPPVFRSHTDPGASRPSGPNATPHHLRRYQSQRTLGKKTPQSNSDLTGATTSQQSEKSEEPEMSRMASVLLLFISTGLVALCAELLVGSIEHLVENSPLSEAFIGLIIIPIVGNAAEHVTAVTVAAKNKLDLSLGVSLGSSIQIALFVTPIVVILGWILDKDMSLYFNLFETATLFVSTFIVNFLVLDGRSNYLEGALLCACYIIIGVGAYFFPNQDQQSSSTVGPLDGKRDIQY